MIQFLTVFDARTEKPTGVILSSGRELAWMAKGETAAALRILVSVDHVTVESRDGTTTIREEIRRGEPKFLAALRYRLVAPLITRFTGQDTKSRSLDEAGTRIWQATVGNEPPPLVRV